MKKKTLRLLAEMNRNFYQTVATDFDATRQGFWEGWERVGAEIEKWVGEKERKKNISVPAEELEQNLEGKVKKIRLKKEEADKENEGKGEIIAVIDLGCGNGRWADFLEQKMPPEIAKKIKYYGFDQNETLLAAASDKIKNKKSLAAAELAPLDLMNLEATAKVIKKIRALNPQAKIMVNLIAVLHHLPSADYRQKFLKTITEELPTESLLIMSLWQFYRSPRLQKKVLSLSRVNNVSQKISYWKEQKKAEQQELVSESSQINRQELAADSTQVNQQELSADFTQLEKGDYFLSWGNTESTAVRYCHHFSDKEINTQIIPDLQKTGSIRACFSADGDSHSHQSLNTYLIWQKVTPFLPTAGHERI